MKIAPGPVSDVETAAGARPATLHQRMQTELETRILSGQWHTGYRIPTEKELAQRYGCSRTTVSKVLMLLAQKGLIESRKRAGSFVRRPPAQSIILQILDPESVARTRGEPYRYEFIDQVSRPATSRDRTCLKIPRRQACLVLSVVCRHFIGARVYCHEERLFNLSLLPAAAGVDFSARAPGDWLIDFMPWRSGDTIIGADKASDALASALEVAVGSPVVTIERLIHANGSAISWGFAWHPADITRLSAHYHTE